MLVHCRERYIFQWMRMSETESNSPWEGVRAISVTIGVAIQTQRAIIHGRLLHFWILPKRC